MTQLPVQITPPHSYGAQTCVFGGGQWPAPSQVAASVATPFAQLASRHETVVSGKVQYAFVPSQVALHVGPEGHAN
jgi:hypothetical protein